MQLGRPGSGTAHPLVARLLRESASWPLPLRSTIIGRPMRPGTLNWRP